MGFWKPYPALGATRIRMCEEISLLSGNKSIDLERKGKSPMRVLEELVNSTVENTLALVLGERVVEAFYSYMLRDFGLKQTDIFSKPSVFSEAVDKAFGKGGDAIQRVIVHNICKRTGIEYTKTNECSLASAIARLKELKCQ